MNDCRLRISAGAWALMFVLACLSTPAGASLQLALEAYYTFDDEDGDDASGKGLTLDLFGDVSFSQGVRGRALFPNGDNARYAARPVNDPALNFGIGDFSVQAWVNYTDTSGEQILLEKFSGASGPGWSFTKLANNRFAFADDAGSTPVLQSAVLVIPLATWHHLLVRRVAGTYQLFFNGELVASVFSTNGAATSAPLLLARRNAVDGRNFALKGSLDEIAIWSRALSDAEIAELYNLGQGQPIPYPARIFADGFEPEPP